MKAFLQAVCWNTPSIFEGEEVPAVLLSGDHAKIAAWRRKQSILRTARLRPDLMDKAPLTDAERRELAELTEKGFPPDA